jgi:hypothetical protein
MKALPVICTLLVFLRAYPAFRPAGTRVVIDFPLFHRILENEAI